MLLIHKMPERRRSPRELFGTALVVLCTTFCTCASDPTSSGGDTVVPETNCDCTNLDAEPCQGTTVTYSLGQGGEYPPSNIVFQFECDGGPCRCGRFANEYDYWVAPPTSGGEVRIVGMLPETLGEADTSLRNGWVANPSATEVTTYMDGRLGAMTDTGRPLRPSVADPHIIDTSNTAVTTVVKSHSMLETGADDCGGTDEDTGLSRHCFWHAAVLTVLHESPPDLGSSVLRPPLTGPEKPLLPVSQIDTSLLPNLPRPSRGDGTVVEDPSWKDAVSLLGPPKVEWGARGNYTYWQYMPPMYNFSNNPSGYAPRSLSPLLDAMQLLAIDGTGHETDKQLLAIRAVQMGVDYYYMWKAGGYGALYRPNGGHAVGRYLAPLVAAALITGNEGDAMKAGLQRVNNGTDDRCGFDISGELHYWSDTDRVLYGYSNIDGCGGYNDYTRQTNSNYVDPDHLGDNGRLAQNEDNDFDDVNSCFGAYQGITAGPTHTTANLARAVPAMRAIAFEHLFTYAARMFDHGAYCRPDHTPAAEYAPAFGSCQDGINRGDPCNNDNDCPDSNCSDHRIQYTSWLARHMWGNYAHCYDDNSCPGMEGL